MAEDRGPPGQPTPYLTRTVAAGERLGIRVLAAKEGETGTVGLVLNSSRETEATEAAAQRARAWLSGKAGGGAHDPAAQKVAIEERIAELMSVAGAAESSEVCLALWSLVRPAFEAGALESALAACDRAVAHYEPLLPPDHSFMQTLRMAQGNVLREQGRAAEALAVEEVALAAFERTVPPEHPDRLKLQFNMAASLRMLGRPEEALGRAQPAWEIAVRIFPPEHPVVLLGRQRVASLAKDLGDPERARSELEDLLAALLRTLPEDAHDVQVIRTELAAACSDLGDFDRARELEEAALEAYERTADPSGADVLGARMNLAVTLFRLGDFERARELYESVLDVRSRTLPEDALDLQTIRMNLSLLLIATGETREARPLLEAAIAALARGLPDEHPLVLSARSNLGIAFLEEGDVAAARKIFEEVLAIRERTCPEDSLHLIRSRQRLATALLAVGEREKARELFDLSLKGMERLDPSDSSDFFWRANGRLIAAATDLPDSALAGAEAVEACRAFDRSLGDLIRDAPPREVEERVRRASILFDSLLTLLEEGAPLARDRQLEAAAFSVAETIRGAGLASAREMRRARRDPELLRLRSSLSLATARAARTALDEAAEEPWRAALETKERLEREILARRPPADPRSSPRGREAASLAQRLAPEEAAIGYRVREPCLELATGFFRRSKEGRLLAFVARRGESPQLVDLGPSAPIEAAVARWRRALEAAPAGWEPARGVVGVVPAGAGGERETGEALRRLVVDPIVPLLGDARRLFVALDGPLHLVPLDALPDGTGRLGDRYEIHERSSLGEIGDPDRPEGEGILLVVGDVDYDLPPAGAERAAPSAEVEREEGKPRASIASRRAWSPPIFPSLPATRAEADAVAAFHGKVFGGGESKAVVLDRDRASKERLREHAPRTRFLHLATHGAYAPESVPSSSDPRRVDARVDLDLFRSRERALLGRSPMVLCGLALSGANRRPEGGSDRPGFITAEEIADLDLIDCDLAVLSACETSAGVLRSGQGLASIQRAFHMAGARTVIASLWSVPDEAARDLMAGFYRRVWVEGTPKHRALWESKKELARRVDGRGAPRFAPRDWAGWVLSGEP